MRAILGQGEQEIFGGGLTLASQTKLGSILHHDQREEPHEALHGEG